MENWDDFWQDKKSGFDYIMRNTTKYFLEKYFENYSTKNTEKILDYGCGPGVLVEGLLKKGYEVVGVDISNYYVDYCKNKFENNTNAVFELVDNENTFEKILSKTSPDLIVAMSVIQYFESEKVLMEFLNQVKNYSTTKNHKIKLLIADVIPKKYSKINDAIDLFFNSVKRGYVLDFFRFMYGIFFSDYSKSKLQVKHFDKDFFEKYALENQLQISIPKKLTVHSKRYSVELVF